MVAEGARPQRVNNAKGGRGLAQSLEVVEREGSAAEKQSNISRENSPLTPNFVLGNT